MDFQDEKNKTYNEFDYKPIKYKTKIIKSGNFLEIYEYSENQFRNLTSDRMPKKKYSDLSDYIDNEVSLYNDFKFKVDYDSGEIYKRTDEEIKQAIKEYQAIQLEKNINRAKVLLRRMFESNLEQYPHRDKFLTLTYKKNMQSRSEAFSDLQTFIKLARRKYGRFEYIAVIERQKETRTALHFHLLIFNFPYLQGQKELNELRKIWGHGFIDLKAIDTYFDLAGYMVKYISKDMSVRSKGEKSYTTSRGLKKHIEVYGTKAEQIIKDKYLIPEYECSYELKKNDPINGSSVTGTVKYKKVLITKGLFDLNENKHIDFDELFNKTSD